MPPWILVDYAYENRARSAGSLANCQWHHESLGNARGHIHIDLVDPDLARHKDGAGNRTGCAVQLHVGFVDDHGGRIGWR